MATKADITKITESLNIPIPADELGHLEIWSREAKRKVPIPYIPIQYIYERANEIFGVFGYDISVDSFSDDKELESRQYVDGQQVMAKSFVITTQVTVYLTDLGVSRSAVGSVVVPAKTYSLSIDGARSKSFAAAVKKCFKGFGKAFGLGLTDEDEENSTDDIDIGEGGVVGETVVKKDPAEFLKLWKETLLKADTQALLIEAVEAMEEAKKEYSLSAIQLDDVKESLVAQKKAIK